MESSSWSDFSSLFLASGVMRAPAVEYHDGMLCDASSRHTQEFGKLPETCLEECFADFDCAGVSATTDAWGQDICWKCNGNAGSAPIMVNGGVHWQTWLKADPYYDGKLCTQRKDQQIAWQGHRPMQACIWECMGDPTCFGVSATTDAWYQDICWTCTSGDPATLVDQGIYWQTWLKHGNYQPCVDVAGRYHVLGGNTLLKLTQTGCQGTAEIYNSLSATIDPATTTDGHWDYSVDGETVTVHYTANTQGHRASVPDGATGKKNKGDLNWDDGTVFLKENNCVNIAGSYLALPGGHTVTLTHPAGHSKVGYAHDCSKGTSNEGWSFTVKDRLVTRVDANHDPLNVLGVVGEFGNIKWTDTTVFYKK